MAPNESAGMVVCAAQPPGVQVRRLETQRAWPTYVYLRSWRPCVLESHVQSREPERALDRHRSRRLKGGYHTHRQSTS